MSSIIDFYLRMLTSRTYWIVSASILVVLLIYLFGYRWRPAVQIQFKQRALLEAVQKNSSSKWGALISENYEDAWGLEKAEAEAGFGELRRHFLFVDLKATDPSVTVDGNVGQVSAMLEVAGRGSPIGEGIKDIVNGLDSPFVFTWQKEGKMPWSWRLIEVSNESLPDLRGYQPGDLESF